MKYHLPLIAILVSSIFLPAGKLSAGCEDLGLALPLTDVSKTRIRTGVGEWHAPRKDGELHKGVDIVPLASHADQSAYAVGAVAGGTVVYSRLNGGIDKGYGNVIVVDHGGDCYSFYAHLSSSPFTALKESDHLLKNVGDEVGAGDLLGYFVDIRADVDSTGNAMKVADATERHMVHFSLIAAPSGRKGSGKLKDDILKDDGQFVDPTSLLTGLGYTKK
jgi:murein DD-endopeptidase MepM/ murein hydrolase activator NlpD